jgi:serine/threonine-protein kinase ATR
MLQSLPDGVVVQSAVCDAWVALLDNLEDDALPDVATRFVAFAFSKAALHTAELRTQLAGHISQLVEKALARLPDSLCGYRVPDFPEYHMLHATKLWSNQSAVGVGLADYQLELLKHDSPVVVRLALSEFWKTLLEYPQLTWVSGRSGAVSEQFSWSAIDVLRKIVLRYHETDSDIMHGCARCLGALGAVDPARMGTPTQSGLAELMSLRGPTMCLDFARKLVEDVLLKEYRAAVDPVIQSGFASALQSILCYTESTDDDTTAEERPLLFTEQQRSYFWCGFSAEARKMLEPFQKSRYCIPLATPEHPKQSTYAQCKSYDDWIQGWVHCLHTSMPSGRVRRLFDACKCIIAIESRVAEFVLPHLVLNGLLEGDEVTQYSIIQEMLAVLRDVGNWRLDDKKQQRCIETITSIVEALFSWIRQERRRNALRVAGTQGSSAQGAGDDAVFTDSKLVEIENLLSQAIPWDLLSDAAFHYKAYARAVLHYEKYVRESSKWYTDPEEMQLHYQQLQLLYTYANELDSVRGISKLLTSKSTRQQLLEHEAANRWSDAQACYEAALQYDKDDMALHCGYINTLKQLGNFGK